MSLFWFEEGNSAVVKIPDEHWFTSRLPSENFGVLPVARSLFLGYSAAVYLWLDCRDFFIQPLSDDFLRFATCSRSYMPRLTAAWAAASLS
jgi:hypothetical protein